MPSALAALLTLFVVYRLGARHGSPRAGLIATVALATTFRFILYARQGLTDLPVTAMAALAVLIAGFAWTSLVILPSELRRFQPMPELARRIGSLVPASDPLAVSGAYRATSLVFSARRPVEVLEGPEAMRNHLMTPGRRYPVLPADDFAAIRREVPRPLHVVASKPIFNVRLRRLLETDPTRLGGTSLLLVKAE